LVGRLFEKSRLEFTCQLELLDKLVFLGVFKLRPAMIKVSLLIFVSIFLVLTPIGNGKAIHLPEQPNFCLFKNPLCFYNLDVLRYLQVLHQKQEYAQMAKFFYGPKKQELGAAKLADAKNWSLTYQRTILGTQENFKIEAALVNDTCRVYLDEKKWQILFERE
jgi:hypothetical protein